MAVWVLYPVNAQQLIISLRLSSVWPGVIAGREQRSEASPADSTGSWIPTLALARRIRADGTHATDHCRSHRPPSRSLGSCPVFASDDYSREAFRAGAAVLAAIGRLLQSAVRFGLERLLALPTLRVK